MQAKKIIARFYLHLNDLPPNKILSTYQQNLTTEHATI